MRKDRTRPDNADLEGVIGAIASDKRRAHAERLIAMMQDVTGEPPTVWNGRIIGFGHYHYRYDSGREGDTFRTGFAARKNDLSIHVMAGLDEMADALDALGPHKRGVSCLYVKSLDAIDFAVLRQIIARNMAIMAARYPT
ncbi:MULTISPECIES: DUF1801 domain-containing protein [unclassified Roseitalea]|uniref:DUF1801 domain-containing protein n=1 Tax=unclassified Roseitalea TaxID=2639107 RepID=UPI0027402B06|nr:MULTISPECIES: DUF1801 domain-containing protein [unclassified Roseitalea]